MSLDLILSPETQALYDRLRMIPLGEEVTYAALSEVIGRDVAGVARSHLNSALRIALREDGAAFKTIRGVGLQRLLPEQAPEIGAAARRKITRASRKAVRGMKALAAASNGLPEEAQRQLSAEISTMGLLAEITKDKAVRALDDASAAPPAVAAMKFVEHIGAK